MEKPLKLCILGSRQNIFNLSGARNNRIKRIIDFFETVTEDKLFHSLELALRFIS